MDRRVESALRHIYRGRGGGRASFDSLLLCVHNDRVDQAICLVSLTSQVVRFYQFVICPLCETKRGGCQAAAALVGQDGTSGASSHLREFAATWLESRLRIRQHGQHLSSLVNAQWVRRIGNLQVAELRLEHIKQAVRDMIADEHETKTILNAVTLLRTMLVGAKGASAQLG